MEKYWGDDVTSEEYIMKCDMYIRYIWYVIYTDW